MPIIKILPKPGLNRENTRYTTEGGYYECDKIRFRQGTPETIGGWIRISTYKFLGVCRSLWNWLTLGGLNLMGVGTNLKYYIELGGVYYDATPVRATNTGSPTFAATNGSATIVVTDPKHGAALNDYVTFTGATSLGGNITALVLNATYQITSVIDENSYTFTASATANASDTLNGGTATESIYEIYFTATTGSSQVQVEDRGHGCVVGDFVTYSGAVTLGGAITATVLNAEQQVVAVIDDDNYVIDVGVNANSSDTGDGGSLTVAEYQVNVGAEIQLPLVGWGAGSWGIGTWGIGSTSAIQLRLWSQGNFGEDLIFGPRGGGLYYWDATNNVGSRGFPISELPGASDTPVVQNQVFVSDVSRFVFCFGCNEIGSTQLDPLLIRWSAQEDAANWTPTAENQSGSLRLSQGSQIIGAVQSRQEIIVFTDTAVYGLQYLGPPFVWGATLLGDGTSIAGPKAAAFAPPAVFWMGKDKFYIYNGNVQTLECNLRQYVFSDMNQQQSFQTFAAVNEGFNEVWWFYCSANSTVIDRYVVYNYAESIWYYGTMGRTAWIDAGIRPNPIAATYAKNLVSHESGVNDNVDGTPNPINAYIETSEFDLGDGDRFAFVRRILPDITFRGSSGGAAPQATLTLKPMRNSGSGYNNPLSEGGNSSANITRIAQVPIEEFTGQIFIRSRGRQFVMRLESNQVGTAWQMGSMRFDIKPDGGRG